MRVVLADDHAVVRKGMRWMLEPLDDIEVVGEAADGGELLSLLERVETDIVLLDIRMPGKGGLDVLKDVRRRHPGVGIIMLSMHDEAAYIRTAIELGASGYLLKSAGISEVQAALEAVASGKAYVQPELTGQVFAEITRDDALTQRDRIVVRLVADGMATKDIATQVGLSEASVKASLAHVFEVLGASTRAEAVAAALRRGLID